MAKTSSPLFGLHAGGTIGKSIVFSSWRGVKYARQHVIPGNPRTTAQQDVRAVFSYLSQLWKNLAPEAQAPAEAASERKPYTSRNILVRENVPILQGATNVSNIMLSPGARGGAPLLALTASTGSSTGTINWSATPPTPPTGWYVSRVVVTALRQQDPHAQLVETPKTVTDTTAPYSGTISGLTSGQQYVITAWAEYTRPDGMTAYGPALNTTATAA